MENDQHFAFGKNWASFAEKISEQHIMEAERGMVRLLEEDALKGKSFLDIGCGSGIHSLAALRLGASRVVALDYDIDSVRTTQELLCKYAPAGSQYEVSEGSVFSLPSEHFDIVYSWGVLHHTGNMIRALECAVSVIRPGGLFVFSLYERLLFDWFWRIEKKWYSQASSQAQNFMRNVFIVLLKIKLFFMRKNFSDYANSYLYNRGMDFSVDVHDWMGGWPYESITPLEVDMLMSKYGLVSVYNRNLGKYMRPFGFFGSGCIEYVYRRQE